MNHGFVYNMLDVLVGYVLHVYVHAYDLQYESLNM